MKVQVTEDGTKSWKDMTIDDIKELAFAALIKNIQSAPGEASVKAAIFVLEKC